MSESPELVLCSGTLLGASFREVVEAAAAGGFDAISIWPHQVESSRRAGMSDADLRACLGDHGVRIEEVEPVLSWLPEGALPASAQALVGPEIGVFLDLAEALGARAVLAVDGFGARASQNALAEAFGSLCDAAALRGLRVKLEFTPWSATPDAASAHALLRAAARPNAGLMIDSWHHFRGANDLAQIAALPGDSVAGIQLNGAPAERVLDDMAAEAMHHRLLPGEGALDGVAFLRALDATGARPPIGAEVFSDALHARTPVEVGRLLGDATRAVVASARS